MGNQSKRYLSIIVNDHENDSNNLFKALSSINNQIGFDLKKELQVLLLTNNKKADQHNTITFFKNLNISFLIRDTDNYAILANEALKIVDTEWVTFMDSRDLLFADGSLLDFLNFSKNPQNNTNLFIFKYLIPIISNNQISDFSAVDYLNFPFGKYFKKSFLKSKAILFNDHLNHYLLEDFTSRAVEICQKPIWINLVNYYLGFRTPEKDILTEFIQYRLTFLEFIQKNNVDGQTYLRDLVWSIVRAFYILEDQNLVNIPAAKQDLLKLVNLLRPFNDYKEKLANEFKQQQGTHKMGFLQFEDLFRGNEE